MNKVRVLQVTQDFILFENEIKLYSNHDSDCCEHHWLSFGDLTMSDFDGLKFDLSGDAFFKRIKGYGIELIPVKGHSVKIPGYGSNNGYYSDQLELVIQGENFKKEFDITECQDVRDN